MRHYSRENCWVAWGVGEGVNMSMAKCSNTLSDFQDLTFFKSFFTRSPFQNSKIKSHCFRFPSFWVEIGKGLRHTEPMDDEFFKRGREISFSSTKSACLAHNSKYCRKNKQKCHLTFWTHNKSVFVSNTHRVDFFKCTDLILRDNVILFYFTVRY